MSYISIINDLDLTGLHPNDKCYHSQVIEDYIFKRIFLVNESIRCLIW